MVVVSANVGVGASITAAATIIVTMLAEMRARSAL
jgi:hypothetical protein